MVDLLDVINRTPVPHLLTIFGAALLFLAFVGKFGTYVELPERRQRLAGVIGALMLVAGVTVTILPELWQRDPARPPEPVADRARDNEVRPPARHAAADQVIEADTASTADEPFYDGPLEVLLPSKALLPQNAFQESDTSLKAQDIVRFSNNSEQAYFIASQADFKGLWQSYQTYNCNGSIILGNFFVFYFDNVKSAKEYFDLIRNEAKTKSGEPGFADYDTRFGEGYIFKASRECERIASRVRTLTNETWLRRGNIVQGAYLQSPADQADSIGLDALSQRLITYMASRTQ